MATTISSGTNPYKLGSPPDFGTLYSGRALEFDGVVDYFNVGKSPINIFDGGGTISAWIKAESDGGSDTARIFSKRSSGLGWFCNVSHDSGSAMKMNFNVEFGGTDGAYITTNLDVIRSTWHHLVITYDSSGAGSSYRPTIYIDGVSKTLTITAN